MSMMFPQAKHPTAIPAAAGYPQLAGNMQPEIMADRLIDRFYNDTILSQISDMSYYGPIMGQGDTVRYYRTPRASVQDYQKDGFLKPETLTAETFTLNINRALAYSMKIDCIDDHQVALMPQMKQKYMENVTRVMANRVERQVMAQAVFEAHAANRGRTAGCYCGNIDLGDMGAPVTLTAKNILIYLAHAANVLDEQQVPRGDRFILMPYCARVLFMAAFGSACFSGAGRSSFLGDGIDLENITGFKIYFTPNIYTAHDRKAGKQVYNMLFGHKSATAFATQIIKTRENQTTIDNFDIYMMGLQVYGFGVALPEALGNLYACIDPTPEIFCC